MATPNTHMGAKAISLALRNVDAVYFLGIGGVSMSSLAIITQKQGFTVGGYDRASNTTTERLEKIGIPVDHVAAGKNLDGYGAVVYTVAIPETQPEYREAVRRGLPLFSRADYMGYLMSHYDMPIGFAGTHGKSTTSLMAANIFMCAEEDPTVFVGAGMPSIDGGFRDGGKQFFLFEACEYMDSFLDFYPRVAVILNIEMDHVDYFHSMEQLCASYRHFAENAGTDGCVIYNADDAICRQTFHDLSCRQVTFGIDSAEADYRAVGVSMEGGYASFSVYHHGEQLFHVTLSVPGNHHIYNALAATAAAREQGLCSRRIAAGLESFLGATRRMEYRGRVKGAKVFDDYGHHPTEVSATLKGAHALGSGRLVCVFQPHTYSRTAALFDDYVTALSVADLVIVAPIYAAREKDDGRVSAKMLADAVGKSTTAMAAENLHDVTTLLHTTVCSVDTVVVMGAGNIDTIFPDLLDKNTDVPNN